MDDELLGYLLDVLDPEDRRGVETYLTSDLDALPRLEHLRQALAPLATDRDTIEPPAGLWVRAIARVAEYQCRQLPRAPATVVRALAPGRRAWRWPDMVVAAAILLCLLVLIPPGLTLVHARYNITACQNNLRNFHTALKGYSDHHNGKFPDVADASPYKAAALFLPMLEEDHLLNNNLSVSCPAYGSQPPRHLSLQKLEAMASREEFDQQVQDMAGYYAYSLGYRDAGGQHGLRLGFDSNNMPLLADCPPGNPEVDQGNSPNHWGKGQNVLYIDGSCKFVTERTVGVYRDDIYLNDAGEVAAGRGRWDAVLAHGAARP